MKHFLCIALFACAASSALAQQEGPQVIETSEAVVPAIAAATPVASDALADTDTLTDTMSVSVGEVLSRLETGIASWYGGRFHGRKTASGEAFDMNALTAAHRKLPFGSWVRVRNLVNGRSVDVRINDRGPYIKRRIIDLSRAAAQALGVGSGGTREVAIHVLTEAERFATPFDASPLTSAGNSIDLK